MSRQGDSFGPLYNASVARKRAEQDSILLANRIRLLRAEEEKTRKKITETEKKTVEVLTLRQRQEERLLAKQAEYERRHYEEQQLREFQNRERSDRQRKLAEGQKHIQDERYGASAAVRLEREAHMRALSEQRAIEAAETRAKAESIRHAGEAASRSRARSEGAKHEAAKSMVRDRVTREEEQRQLKQGEIDKMEREEAALIARLQHTQERHKAAFMQLEDALRSDAPMLTNGPRSDCGTPLASHRGTSERARQLGASPTAAVGASSSSGPGSRPPRPRAAASAGTSSSSSAAPRLPPRPSEPGPRPESASRSSARVAAGGKPAPQSALGKGPGGEPRRALSSCSTSAESGPASLRSLHSGPSTPSSGAQAPISYTTCDGAQIEIPAEEELDLNSLLNS